MDYKVEAGQENVEGGGW